MLQHRAQEDCKKKHLYVSRYRRDICYFGSNVRSEANFFSVDLYRYISMRHAAFMHLQNRWARPRHFDLRVWKLGRSLEFRRVGQLFVVDFYVVNIPSRCANRRFTVIPIYEPTISVYSCTGLLRRKVAYLSSWSLYEVDPIRIF